MGISHFSRRSQKYEMSLDATGGSGTLLDPTNAKLKGWTGPLMDMSGVIFMGSPMFDHDDMRTTFRARLLTMVRHAMGTSMGTRVLNYTTQWTPLARGRALPCSCGKPCAVEQTPCSVRHASNVIRRAADNPALSLVN